jgi:predicted transcriptional regulator
MKTTIDISEHLLIEAKKLAADLHRPLRYIFEDALRSFLAERRACNSRPKSAAELPVCNAGKPLPGIDLNDTSKLLEIE